MRLLPIALAAAAATLGARLARREWGRINAELDRLRARDRTRLPTLKRDGASGEWRP